MNTIEKGLLVLESLAEFEFPVSLKLLCQKTKVPKPTLYRILQTLLNTGYVSQDGAQGNYAISPKLAEVGNSRRYANLKAGALPLMEGLYNSFNETVNLGVLIGANVQYLHVLETTKPLRWIVRPGAQDAYYCTALGRAIVAFLPQEAQDSLLARSKLEQRTERTPQDTRQLRQILKETRDNGWAVDDEENASGVICFATPLFRGGDPVAAMSVSLPKSRVTAGLKGEIIRALEALDRDLNSRKPVQYV
ncbi:MAG: IclR family transcriptional regulator [Trueperaceae bacterium]